MNRPAPHRLGRTALAAALAAGLLGLALFLAASWSLVGRDPEILRQRVADAFASAQLKEDPYNEGSTTTGSHQWNDCLILLMAIDQRGDLRRLALSPLLASVPGGHSTDDNPCAVLSVLAGGAGPAPQVSYYDRYVHGAVVLVRWLLPDHSVRQLRALYRDAQSGVLAAALALALAGLVRSRDPVPFAVLAVAALTLMRGFGLESFSQSLGHGPADTVIAIYLAVTTALALAGTGPAVPVVVAAVFGAATIVFELFTGGVPLGAALVIALAPIAVRAPVRPRAMSIAALAAFLGAGAILYAGKLAAVVAMAGPAAAADILNQAAHYSAAGEGPGVSGAIRSVLASVGVLTGGMTLLSALLLGLAAAAGARGLAVLLRSPDPAARERALLLAVSTLAAPAWFLVFANQTAVHAWFMDRILVWPLAAGFALFAAALAAGRPAAAVVTDEKTPGVAARGS